MHSLPLYHAACASFTFFSTDSAYFIFQDIAGLSYFSFCFRWQRFHKCFVVVHFCWLLHFTVLGVMLAFWKSGIDSPFLI